MKKNILLLLLTASAVTLSANIPAPWGGTLDLAGNGKFTCRGAVLPLVKGKSYRFDFKITKLPPLSEKKIEHRLMLYAVNGRGVRTDCQSSGFFYFTASSWVYGNLPGRTDCLDGSSNSSWNYILY